MAILTGSSGNETLVGGNADDTLIGGGGSDSLLGGGGTDTVQFTGNYGDYTIGWNGSTRRYTVADNVGGRDGTAVIGTVEQFQFADGMRYWNDLLLTGGDGLVRNGTLGSDTYIGGVGYDKLSGRDGDDSLVGGLANDTLIGGAGADTLEGGMGDDSLDGGSGLLDRAIFEGDFADYDASWDPVSRSYLVEHLASGEIDTVRGVDIFEFDDAQFGWDDFVAGEGEGLYLNGTANQDFYDGSLGYDSITGGDNDDVLQGLGADDTLRGGADEDILVGGAGNDLLDGGTGRSDEAHFTGEFTDYEISWDAVTRSYTVLDLRAGSPDGQDVLTAVEYFMFVDPLDPGALVAYDWGQLVPGEGDGMRVIGTANEDAILGSEGYDYLDGGAGSDIVDGLASDDTILGGSGQDQLAGWEGDDFIDGGTGHDDAYFFLTHAEYTITWDPVARTYTVSTADPLGDGTDVLTGVEHFWFADGPYDWSDLVDGEGDGLKVTGTAHSDFQLLGSPGYDTMAGGDGNDNLYGWEYDYLDPDFDEPWRDAADSISGGTGADTLHGGGGDDTLDGGTGADTAVFTDVIDNYQVDWDALAGAYTITHLVPDSDGTDTFRNLESFSFVDPGDPEALVTLGLFDLLDFMEVGRHLTGTAGIDFLNGNAFDDVLRGLGGGDSLSGFDGNDSLDGGAGNDLLIGDGGDDTLVGGSGIDQAMYIGPDAATVNLNLNTAQDTGGYGFDTLTGVENVWGGDGNDNLTGSAVANRLDGNNGDDTLEGGLGIDSLYGGAGLDHFVFTSAPATSNYDRVYDFGAADDTIDLDSAIFTALAPGGLDPAAFQSGTTNSALTAATRIVFNTTTGALYYDANGLGGAAGVRFAVLELTGLAGPVTAADFNVF